MQDRSSKAKIIAVLSSPYFSLFCLLHFRDKTRCNFSQSLSCDNDRSSSCCKFPLVTKFALFPSLLHPIILLGCWEAWEALREVIKWSVICLIG